MPQRGGSESYADRFRREKLGKTGPTLGPGDGPVRSGADALPSRSLGDPYFGPPMSNLNQTLGQALPPGSIPWERMDLWQSAAPGGHSESMAYSMAELANRIRAQEQPPQTGYGGTTPGSVPVSNMISFEDGSSMQVPIPGAVPVPRPPIDYAGGGGGVTANDILGQFGPVVTQPVDPIMTLLQAFLRQRR